MTRTVAATAAVLVLGLGVSASSASSSPTPSPTSAPAAVKHTPSAPDARLRTALRTQAATAYRQLARDSNAKIGVLQQRIQHTTAVAEVQAGYREFAAIVIDDGRRLEAIVFPVEMRADVDRLKTALTRLAGACSVAAASPDPNAPEVQDTLNRAGDDGRDATAAVQADLAN